MKHLTRAAIVILVGALMTTPTLAGIADSSLPILVAGKKTLHVYSVPSVIRNHQDVVSSVSSVFKRAFGHEKETNETRLSGIGVAKSKTRRWEDGRVTNTLAQCGSG